VRVAPTDGAGKYFLIATIGNGT